MILQPLAFVIGLCWVPALFHLYFDWNKTEMTLSGCMPEGQRLQGFITNFSAKGEVRNWRTMPRRVALAIEWSDFKAIFLWVKGAWSLLFTIFLMSKISNKVIQTHCLMTCFFCPNIISKALIIGKWKLVLFLVFFWNNIVFISFPYCWLFGLYLNFQLHKGWWVFLKVVYFPKACSSGNRIALYSALQSWAAWESYQGAHCHLSTEY